MNTFLRFITIFSRRRNTRVPMPWDDVPNSEAATVTLGKGLSVSLTQMEFLQGINQESASVTGDISVFSISLTAV